MDLIDDSGTPLTPGYANATFAAQQRESWNLDATLPPGCEECKEDTSALLPFYAKTFTDHRGALLSYTQDTVISQFNLIDTDKFAEGLDQVAKDLIDPHPNLHYFFVGGKGHVLMGDPTLATNGVTVKQWLTQMVSDDAAWASQHP